MRRTVVISSPELAPTSPTRLLTFTLSFGSISLKRDLVTPLALAWLRLLLLCKECEDDCTTEACGKTKIFFGRGIVGVGINIGEALHALQTDRPLFRRLL